MTERKFVFLILALAAPAWGANDAGLPGAYLNEAGGPQVLGMGKAFVGLADGTDAVAWNPAGLGFLRPNTMSFMHTQTAQNARLESLGYAQPLFRLGGVGLHYLRLDSGAIAQTDDLNRQVGDFRDVQQTVMMGYGLNPFQFSSKSALQRLSFGSTAKFSQQSLAGTTASGWGLDVGALAAFKHGLGLGVRIQNLVAPKLNYETASDTFPRSVTIGGAARFFNDRLIATTDVEKQDFSTVKLRSGLEGTLWNIIKLRGGFDYQERDFTLGLGYVWGRYQFNYSSNNSQMGVNHFFGLTYAFGGYPILIQASPESFSPTGMQKNTTMAIQVNHSKKIFGWEVQITTQEKDLVRIVRGSGNPPPAIQWDGTNGMGVMVPAGIYVYVLTVIDEDNRRESTPPQTVRIDYGTPLDTLELHTR